MNPFQSAGEKLGNSSLKATGSNVCFIRMQFNSGFPVSRPELNHYLLTQLKDSAAPTTLKHMLENGHPPPRPMLIAVLAYGYIQLELALNNCGKQCTISSRGI